MPTVVDSGEEDWKSERGVEWSVMVLDSVSVMVDSVPVVVAGGED